MQLMHCRDRSFSFRELCIGFFTKEEAIPNFFTKEEAKSFYNEKGGQWSSCSRKGRPKGLAASDCPIIS